MREMAGYRNRMVHFYHEIKPEEFHKICLHHVDEIRLLTGQLGRWVKEYGTSVAQKE